MNDGFSWSSFFEALLKKELKDVLFFSSYFGRQDMRELLLANFFKIKDLPIIRNSYGALEVLKSFVQCRRFEETPTERYLVHLYLNCRGNLQ